MEVELREIRIVLIFNLVIAGYFWFRGGEWVGGEGGVGRERW